MFSIYIINIHYVYNQEKNILSSLDVFTFKYSMTAENMGVPCVEMYDIGMYVLTEDKGNRRRVSWLI